MNRPYVATAHKTKASLKTRQIDAKLPIERWQSAQTAGKVATVRHSIAECTD